MLKACKLLLRRLIRSIPLGRPGRGDKPTFTATRSGCEEGGVECPDCGTFVVVPTEPTESSERVEYHTARIRRRIQQRISEKGILIEQWIEKGVICPNVQCRAFVKLGRDGASCFAVTRHGFEEKGVTCPICGELAVEPGDWRKVQTSEKIERDKRGIEQDRWTEEGVCCWGCNSYLMASPDSDIDPIELGADYDREVYHRFVRPDNWEPPTQRTEDRPVEVDDWIVINRGVIIEINGNKQDVGGGEGRVKSIKDGLAEIMTTTLPELGQTHLIKLAIEHCKPMVFDTLKAGTPIKVTRGKYRGVKGVVLETQLGRITVRLENDTTTTLPIERVARDLGVSTCLKSPT